MPLILVGFPHRRAPEPAAAPPSRRKSGKTGGGGAPRFGPYNVHVPFWRYTALRFGLTVAFFILFWYLGTGPVFGVIFGAIVAWCVCFLFFNKWRDAAGIYLRDKVKRTGAPKRNKLELDDAAAEDEADPNVRPQNR